MTKTMKQAESVAMRRALTTGLLAAAALSAAAERVAVAQASPDAVVKAQLAALGKRRTAELVTEMIVAIPWDGGIAPRASSAEGGDVQVPGKGGKPHEIYVGAIPSLGALDSCARPTAEERATVLKAVAAADPAMRAVEGSSVRFGCKEKGGILLDVAYEDQKTGTWKVVRASDLSAKARISVVASYRGTPTDQWMEWANEVTLSTLALADLDGDGTRDALLAQDQHEGGAMGHDVTLSLWLSSKGKVVALGTLSGAVSIAAQPWKPAASAATAGALPLVVRAAPLTSEDRLHYRCVQLAGKLDTCSAIEAAWKAERALGVAQRFIAGELCEPERDQWGQLKERKGPCVLDAEMMAAQLDVLGTSAAERALLLAKLPPPSAKAQVKRAVHAALEVVMPQKRVYGELIETPTGPDPRRAELLPLLGDAECPPATPAQTKALEARINGWLAGNAARLLVERGACKPGTPCQWKKPDRFAAQQTCSAGGRAQLAGRWTHLGEQGAQLAIDALFYVDAKR